MKFQKAVLRPCAALAMALATCSGAVAIGAVGSAPAGATPNCTLIGTPGSDLSSCLIENQNLSGLDFTGDNLTNAVFDEDIMTGAVFTGANVTGADFSVENPDAQMTNLVSGNLIGTPAALPIGLSLVDGYFVRQGTNAGTTTTNCNAWDEFTPPAGTTGLTFDVIGGAGGNGNNGALGWGQSGGGSPGTGGFGGQGTAVTGSSSWSTSDGSLWGAPGCGGFFGAGGGTNDPTNTYQFSQSEPGGLGITDTGTNPATQYGYGGGSGNYEIPVIAVNGEAGASGGSGGAMSALCLAATLTSCQVIAGGGGGGGGGGDESGDNGGDGGSGMGQFANGGNDGADASTCAFGGGGGVNGGGGGSGWSNNGGGGVSLLGGAGNGGGGATGGNSDNDDYAGGGGGGGGGYQGGGGGGGNASMDGAGCSGGGGGGAGSSACGGSLQCTVGLSGLPDSGLNQATNGRVTIAFSGYVAPPPIIGSGSSTLTYGQAVNTSLTSLGPAQPTFGETGTLPNGVTFDSTTGAFSGTPTTTGTYPITVTASNGFGSGSRPLTITVAPAATLGLSTPSIKYGTEYTESFAVQVSANGATPPKGTVAVQEGSTTLCTLTLSFGRGKCSLSASELPAGTHGVTAAYSPSSSSSLAAATSASRSLVVGAAVTTTTLNVSAPSVAYGNENTETVSVTVAAVGATPQGTAAVKVGASTLCNVTLSGGVGTCSLSAFELPPGSYSLKAFYTPSSANFSSSSSAHALKVTPLSSPGSESIGMLVNRPGVAGGTLPGEVILSGGTDTSGSISFDLYYQTCASAPVYTDVVPVSGNGSYDTSSGSNPGGYAANTAGTYFWIMSYGGDTSDGPVTTGCGPAVPITKATPAIAYTGPVSVPVGNPVNGDASVSGGDSPTGTVTFFLFNDANCSSPVYTETDPLSGGAAGTTVGYPGASVGTYYWVAIYNGDSNNNAVATTCAAGAVNVALIA